MTWGEGDIGPIARRDGEAWAQGRAPVWGRPRVMTVVTSTGYGPRCPKPLSYHGEQTPRKPIRLLLIKPDAEMEMKT